MVLCRRSILRHQSSRLPELLLTERKVVEFFQMLYPATFSLSRLQYLNPSGHIFEHFPAWCHVPVRETGGRQPMRNPTGYRPGRFRLGFPVLIVFLIKDPKSCCLGGRQQRRRLCGGFCLWNLTPPHDGIKSCSLDNVLGGMHNFFQLRHLLKATNPLLCWVERK